MTKKTVTTTTANTGLVAHTGSVEERAMYLGLGSTNVGANDMAIPRLKLLQMINEEVTPGNPRRIEGAQAGMIMNSLSEALSTSMFVVNLHFSRRTVVWRKRKLGGGIFGTYENEAEARIALQDAGEDEKNYDISENPTHLLMLVNEEGQPKGVVLIDMPGVKIKVSKKWNSLIAEAEQEGHPRFGCVWHLGVTAESNNQGNYFNFDLLDIAEGSKFIVAPDHIYQAAVAHYTNFFKINPPSQDEAA